jgi:hypothetical protein
MRTGRIRKQDAMHPQAAGAQELRSGRIRPGQRNRAVEEQTR